MTHFNGLSPAEAERLALLLEEAGEVVQAVGKILRHGYESTHPNGSATNRENLTREIADVQVAVSMMSRAGDIRLLDVDEWAREKRVRVSRYLHHQDALTGEPE